MSIYRDEQTGVEGNKGGFRSCSVGKTDLLPVFILFFKISLISFLNLNNLFLHLINSFLLVNNNESPKVRLPISLLFSQYRIGKSIEK